MGGPMGGPMGWEEYTMKNALKAIVDTEHQAGEILQAAAAEVRAIEAQAKEDVDRILREDRSAGERETQRLLASSKEGIEHYRVGAVDRWTAELDRLQERFESAKAEAVEQVIRRITLSCADP